MSRSTTPLPWSARDEEGNIECWGRKDEDAEDHKEVPDARFTQFDITSKGGCGVTRAGALACWGD